MKQFPPILVLALLSGFFPGKAEFLQFLLPNSAEGIPSDGGNEFAATAPKGYRGFYPFLTATNHQ